MLAMLAGSVGLPTLALLHSSSPRYTRLLARRRRSVASQLVRILNNSAVTLWLINYTIRRLQLQRSQRGDT